MDAGRLARSAAGGETGEQLRDLLAVEPAGGNPLEAIEDPRQVALGLQPPEIEQPELLEILHETPPVGRILPDGLTCNHAGKDGCS